MTKYAFLDFVLKNRINRIFLTISVFAMLSLFIVFKLLYPYPDFFSDSYSYIYAASAHLGVSQWPIGYSKFLAIFHLITHSDLALVAFQYFFLELSLLFFFFSILYFFSPSQMIKRLLFIFLFFNPIFLYLSNYVNSDPLFAALSVLWFTQLLWIIHRPALYHLFIQAMLLFICFTVRNNAYIYPFVSVVAFLLAKAKPWFKWVGILMPILFIVPFIVNTMNAAKKMTGTSQFSFFTGWQLANNSLYMRNHINVDSNLLPTSEAREIDRYAVAFFKKQDHNFDEYIGDFDGNFFIKYDYAPLKRFLRHHYNYRDRYGSIVAWGKASAVFDEYGSWVIRHYPISYFRYFMLLNLRNYLFPKLEKLEVYNLGESSVEIEAQEWFDYQTPSVSAVSFTAQKAILNIFPFLFLLANSLCLCGLIWWVIRGEYHFLTVNFNRVFILSMSLILLNILFSICATVNVFRYQVFPLVVLVTSSLLFAGFMDTEGERRISGIKSHNLNKKSSPEGDVLFGLKELK